MMHPRLAEWVAHRFGQLTEIQSKALRHTLKARNTLILAPTGSGKTLAAFLSVLSQLGHLADRGRLGNRVRAIYVSPLKALDRDIHRNLAEPLAVLNEGRAPAEQIRMEVRTGDTEMVERARQQRRRPHLLLTTPESLSSLLSQSTWKDALVPVAVVVDEIHAFAENKRGTLLTLSMERLEGRAEHGLQRIGLSATAWPLEAVSGLLCGLRRCEVAAVNIQKTHRLDVSVPEKGISLPAAGYSPFRIAPLVAKHVESAQSTLVFSATRSATEKLGLALSFLLEELGDQVAVHHGSIDRAQRLAIESRLASGEMRAVVCSTSLELGVDFQAVDQVLLIGAPRGVSRALQRLGRSGHRVDGVAQGWLIPLSLPDLLECAALREAARNGRLDALRVPKGPLDVLAQVLLGMAVERRWGLEEAYELVRRAGPYLGLTREDFDAVVEFLAGGGKVLGGYGTYGKIVVADGQFQVAGRKTARQYYSNIGTITADFHVQVLSRGGRKLGEVEEGFLGNLRPGEAFIIGGKSVRVTQMLSNTAIVEPAQGERVVTPRWMGGRMSLSARLAAEELRLRRMLREAWSQGGEAECRRVLTRRWKLSTAAAQRIGAFVARQNAAAPLPVDEPVQVERLRQRGGPTLLLFHVVAGRAVNRSLAWTLGQRFARWSTPRPSVVVNFDDHAFLLSVDRRLEPEMTQLRTGFDPEGWREDLAAALAETETLGKRFRSIAEIGQLLPRRTPEGRVSARSSSWSGSLLYTTLRKHEPNHPLVREALREVMEDELDAANAHQQAARIWTAEWEVFDLPRPSPISLPLFSMFQREVLITQDPDAALDDLVTRLYAEWETEV